jgi:hypothetical protein
MSVARANLIALLWLPLSALLTVGPFLRFWGPGPISHALPAATDLRVMLPLILVGVLAHEALHAVGFLLLGRAPRAAVRIGFQRRTLTPFASCGAAVTAGAYRAASLLPALVLGVLPTVLAWLLGSGGLVLWGWVMLALAGGDLAAVWAMRAVPRGVLVLDHPSRVGCRLAEAPVQ